MQSAINHLENIRNNITYLRRRVINLTADDNLVERTIGQAIEDVDAVIKLVDEAIDDFLPRSY